MSKKSAPDPHSPEGRAKARVVSQQARKQYPGMSPDMAALLGKLATIDETEFLRPLSAGKETQIAKQKGEIKQADEVIKQRALAKQALIPDSIRAEYETLMKLLSDTEALPDALDHIDKLDALISEVNAEIDLRQSKDFQQAIKKSFFTLFQTAPGLVNRFIILFSCTNDQREALVDFDEEIKKGLIDLIENGELMYAIRITKIINDCKRVGFYGETYYSRLNVIPDFEQALRKGYRLSREQNNDYRIRTYEEAAQVYDINL